MSKQPRIRRVNTSQNTFGGKWTEVKLQILEKYVSAYLNIMKGKQFKTIYFDGFAGPGWRKEAELDSSDIDNRLPLGDQYLRTQVYTGSPQRILNLPNNHFDFYYFIDKEHVNCAQLELLKDRHPNRRIEIRNTECGPEVKKLGDALRKDPDLRALVFLDPFGMEISWSDLACLAKTNSDLWILVPTGHPIPKLFRTNGSMYGVQLLERFFGVTEVQLQSHFGHKVVESTLFGDQERVQFEKISEKAASLYQARLLELYSCVAEPFPLKNNSNRTAFHLVFCSQNRTGMKIAHDILDKMNKP